MSVLTKVIQDHWAVLDASPKGSAWLTSALPVNASGLPVLCALGPDGKRHLLVPLPTAGGPRPDTRAAAVHLLPLLLETDERLVHFADLALLREDLSDIFTDLCSDVVSALAADPPNPSVVVSEVLDGWHELLRSGIQLGIEQLAGLFGELTVLNSLMDLRTDMLGTWKGPFRSPQDFVEGPYAIEVKATASSDGRRVRIHGIDQLSPAPDGGLMLWWMRFDTSGTGGVSVPELVASTAARIARPHELWQLLARSGYYTTDSEHYGGVRFGLVEEAMYRVTNDFPCIVPASFPGGLPLGISDIGYTLDLESGPKPMRAIEVREFLNIMAAR